MGSIQRQVQTTEECRDAYFTMVGAFHGGDMSKTAKVMTHEDIVQMYLMDG